MVLATNSPIHHNLAIHSRQEPYRSYVVGLRIPEVDQNHPKLPLRSSHSDGKLTRFHPCHFAHYIMPPQALPQNRDYCMQFVT